MFLFCIMLIVNPGGGEWEDYLGPQHQDRVRGKCNHQISLTTRIEVMDWAFRDAQENWVIDQLNGSRWPEFQAPRPIDGYLVDLSSRYYPGRIYARMHLKKMGQDAAPWLFWGLRSGEAETRMWCEKRLWQLSECDHCSQYKEGPVICNQCHGYGTWWPWPLDRPAGTYMR